MYDLNDPREATLDPASSSFHDLVSALANRCHRDPSGVAHIYSEWIAAHPESPHLAPAWFNLGCEAANEGDAAKAAAAYTEALRIQPRLYQAAINLGLLQERNGLPDSALTLWQSALQTDEARIALLNQQARLLEELGRLDQAQAMLSASLATVPAQPDAIQHWIHLRQKMCVWPVIPPYAFGLSPEELLSSAGPLAALALTDKIAAQATVACAWVINKTSRAPVRLSPTEGYDHHRLRIGYMSSDFGQHAMGYLIAELFEQHDRERFRVYGYGLGRDDGSTLRARIMKSFDVFTSLETLSDEDAANRIMADEIDILIDLNGLTRGSRPQILRWRPAPVQATYLGFVGPVPVPEIDYLLCDDYVVPEHLAAQYSPTPLYISPIYQVNDRCRDIDEAASRASVGLPDRSFVFCNFSNHFKIISDVFQAWMNILNRVPGSVLWLAEDNAWSRRNLVAQAERLGVDSCRLIFTGRVSPAAYMARFPLADLYLDTFPYNSGTVASDAIRMSLPLVTLRGEAFASRMAARLLSAIGADLGIAESLAGYIETAVLLATRPDIHASYRAMFTLDVWRRTIGDVKAFTRNLEMKLIEVAVPRSVSAAATHK